MDVQLRPERIREERRKRAWTQEHLAELAGLGVRTVQRIEAGGTASLESAAALSSVLSVSLAELRVNTDTGRAGKALLRLKPIDWIAFGIGTFGVLLVSPPNLLIQAPLFLIMIGAYLFGRIRYQ